MSASTPLRQRSAQHLPWRLTPDCDGWILVVDSKPCGCTLGRFEEGAGEEAVNACSRVSDLGPSCVCTRAMAGEESPGIWEAA